jgi:hypothetical protein
MPTELDIEIGPNGEVKVQPRGAKGQACMDWADLMVRILGKEISRQPTSEFYETELDQARQVEVKRHRQT